MYLSCLALFSSIVSFSFNFRLRVSFLAFFCPSERIFIKFSFKVFNVDEVENGFVDVAVVVVVLVAGTVIVAVVVVIVAVVVVIVAVVVLPPLPPFICRS